MRLDGAKKSQGACQALISWEDAGPAMMDLGLLLSSFVFRACRELAHPPTRRWAAGWAASFRKRATAREHQAPWGVQGHLAWSEVLHKGQPDCEGCAGKQGRAWQRHGRDKVRSAGIMSCLSQTEKYRRGASVLHQAPLCHGDRSYAPGRAESQHRRLMIAVCRDPDGLCRWLSAYRDAQSQRRPRFWGCGYQGAPPPSPKDSVRSRWVRGEMALGGVVSI